MAQGIVALGIATLGIVALAAAAQPAGPPDTGAARQQLQDTERARTESLAAQREAASRAAAAAEAEQHLAAARAEAAARLHDAEAATLAVANRIDALARQRQDADDRLKARAADLAPLLPVRKILSRKSGTATWYLSLTGIRLCLPSTLCSFTRSPPPRRFRRLMPRD